ncbi:general secretion pathway protein GspB [Pseudomonas sp. SA3-5]|uniref:General secretion pathway protein GspB n=1 Tax=Pseudomonas aestuarii TaxID=3018340 RepID=A0ABT4XFF4_9PSED|nr:general secretion pathway protein GspB [Pseudomonas aestuarii]MDA7086950.1 general secretion pathway protein GspB [Pseudomonas aestuarii]
MSYILNALKHSESQRNRGEIPHIDSQPEFGKVQSRKWTDHLWKWLALAALVALLLSLAWGLFGAAPSNVPATPAASAAAVEPATLQPASPDVIPLALPEPREQAPGLPALQGMAGVRIRLDDEAEPGAAGASGMRESPRVVLDMPVSRGVAAPPTPSRAAPAVVREALPVRAEAPPEEVLSGVNHWKTLPADVQRQIREMAFSAHIYSSDPAARFIRVSGRTLREGDQLGAQLKLLQIARDGIVFSYNGDKFWFGFN